MFVQTSSLMVDDDDIMTLFNDIATFLEVMPVVVQDSPDSPITNFSEEKVEDAQSMIAAAVTALGHRRCPH